MTWINLLPAHYALARQRQARRRGWLTFGLAAGCVAVLWGAAVTVQWMSLRHRVAEARAALQPWESHLDQLKQVRKERDTLASQVATLDRLRDPIPLSAVLALLSQVCPDQVVIEQMQILVPDPVLPVAASRDRKATAVAAKPRLKTQAAATPAAMPITLQLEGLAATDVVIARMASQLAQSGLFRHVRVDSAQPTQVHGQAVHQFRMSIEIPAAPPRDMVMASAGHGEGGR